MKVTGKVQRNPLGEVYIDVHETKNLEAFSGLLNALGVGADVIVDVVSVEQALLEARAAKELESKHAEPAWNKGEDVTLLTHDEGKGKKGGGHK